MSKSFGLILAFVVLLVPLLARMRALPLPLAAVSVLLAAIRLPGVRGCGAKRHHMPFLVLPLAERLDLTQAGS